MVKNTTLFFLLFLAKLFNAQLPENIIKVPDRPDPLPSKILKKVLDEAAMENGSRNDPLRNCPITSQFELDVSHSIWILRSLDINGAKKSVGGDELYITFYSKRFRNHPTAVALLKDHENGSYTLQFRSTPMHPELYEYYRNGGRKEDGILFIHYISTCGISDLTPGEKRYWKNGGFFSKRYEVQSIKAPQIRKFEPPSLPKTLKPFDFVLGIGDSMMMKFAGVDATRPRSNGNYSPRFSSPLNSLTAKHYLEKIRIDIEHEKSTNKIFQNNPTAKLLVVVGSGVWDLAEKNLVSKHLKPLQRTHYLLDKEFSDHKKGVQIVLDGIAKEYLSEPNIQFAWKSNTAIHQHKVPDNEFALNHTKCITSKRAKRIYVIQRALTSRYDMPFLDIYEATYLSADYHTDTSHFLPDFDELTWNWFFPQRK